MNIIIALLVLNFIITVHELGHFLLAKKHGMAVVEFSIGMGPRIASLMKGGTRYSLKLFPIGGSCQLLGEDQVIDDQSAFHKKGPWARFSVLFAGAFFNFLLAFILAIIYLGASGVDKPFVVDIVQNGPSKDALMVGDVIKKINGAKVQFSRDIDYFFIFNPLSGQSIDITYEREGAEFTTSIQPVAKDIYKLGIGYSATDNPAVLESVVEKYPLANAGLIAGDTIVSINSTEISTGKSLFEYFNSNPLTATPLKITYIRDGSDRLLNTIITPKLERSEYDIGFNYNYMPIKSSSFEVIKYSFGEIRLNIETTLKSFLYLITGRVSIEKLAGPIGIITYVGEVIDSTRGAGLGTTLLALAQFSLLISVNIGVMNLLPLPALDGGRLVFIFIEIISRKPVPREKESLVHIFGFLFLILLLIFITFNDIRHLF